MEIDSRVLRRVVGWQQETFLSPFRKQGGSGSGTGQDPLSGVTGNLPGTGTSTGNGGGGKGGGGVVSETVEDVVDGVNGLVEGLTDPLHP